MANPSAIDKDHQTPSPPNINGKIMIAVNWKTMSLNPDMSADTTPLFNAVKNDDKNIDIPQNKKQIE